MATHHIAAMLAPSWGHAVSYIYLATRMLQKDPTLVITFVQHNLLVAKMEAELETCEYDSKRLRIIGVGEREMLASKTMFLDALHEIAESWKEIILKLSQANEGWPTPHAIHMDMFAGGFIAGLEHTKQIMGENCKILMWYSTSVAFMPPALSQYDFAAIADEIYLDEARCQGRSMDAILNQVARAFNGSDELSGVVVKCPGVPDMYDHELMAYAAGPPSGAAVYVSAQKLAKFVDGYIVPSGVCLEPVGVPYCRDFYQKRGQELFTVGMQVHELGWTDASPAPPTNTVVKSFLESSVNKYGARSVLYISFGSVFFPTATPELIEGLVNTLLTLDNPFPFIFVAASRMASLPQELIKRVHSSGKGLVCDFWVEQRAILQHAAVGWFLTHGGFNSLSESLSQGIPLIVWPVGAEQPINAALISSGPNPVGIELLQVRTGRQLAPSLRGGPPITGTLEDATEELKAAFDAARGPSGAILRENAAKMARALRQARDGEALDEILRLARFYMAHIVVCRRPACQWVDPEARFIPPRFSADAG
ncbi:hypothetical protein DFH09DRAFT_1284111 [Mycena vulgaris]|nr:hypothetical protein DFH09DRAFT_1284111 [Mycena vulgaris]